MKITSHYSSYCFMTAILILIAGIDMKEGNAQQQIQSRDSIVFDNLTQILTLAVSNDEQFLFVGGWKGTNWQAIDYTEKKHIAYIYSLQRKEIITTFLDHPGYISCACFSPNDKRIVTTGYPYTAWYWDVQSGELLQKIPTGLVPTPYNHGMIYGLDFFQDGIRVIVGTDRGNIIILNLLTGEQLMTFNPGAEGAITQIKFLDLFQNEEKILVSSGFSTAQVRSTKDGSYLYSIGANAIVIDPKEMFFLGTINDCINRYNIDTGENIEKVSTFIPTGMKRVFSPNAKYLASDRLEASDGKIPYANIIDVNSGKMVGEFRSCLHEINIV